jgi:hypothetical protein
MTVDGTETARSTPTMQIGWVLALVGMGGSMLSGLPRYVAGYGGIALALVGIVVVVVGARLRDGKWFATAPEMDYAE